MLIFYGPYRRRTRTWPAMSDLSFNLNVPSPAWPPDAEPNSSSRWKKATLAGFLSLLLPGMGQLYNRQSRKAFGVAVLTHVLGALMTHTRLLLSFPTMVEETSERH